MIQHPATPKPYAGREVVSALMTGAGRGMAQALALATACLLLLLPAQAAHDARVATMETGALVVEGQADLSGGLGGLLYQHKSLDGSVRAQGFGIEAQELVVVSHWEDVVQVGPAGSQPLSEPKSTRTVLTDASVMGDEPRREYRLAVLPGEDTEVSVVSHCLDLLPSPVPERTVQPRVAGAPFTFALGDAMQVEPCFQATLAVEGAFTLSLWQWNATVRSDDGGLQIVTGSQWGTPRGPDVPLVREDTYVGNDTEAFLHVRDGLLTLPLVAGEGALEIYMDEVQPSLVVGTLGANVERGEMGAVAGGRSLDGQAVTLQGEFALSSTNEEDLLRVDVNGAAGAAWADGSEIPLETGATHAAVPPSADTRFVWGVVAGVMVGGGGGVLLHRRTCRNERRGERARKCFARAQDLESQGNAAAAMRWCQKAIRYDPRNVDPYALRARCHFLMGDLDAALRDHRRVHKGLEETDDDARGWNAFEAARTCARAGRNEDASAWLRIASAIDREYRDMAATDPDLALLGDEPRRLRPGRGGRPSA